MSFFRYRFHGFYQIKGPGQENKKSICGSDVICLTFSSLGVMNGKVRKQMTKSVDGKECLHRVWSSVFSVQYSSEQKWAEPSRWMEREFGQIKSTYVHPAEAMAEAAEVRFFALLSLASNHRAEANAEAQRDVQHSTAIQGHRNLN